MREKNDCQGQYRQSLCNQSPDLRRAAPGLSLRYIGILERHEKSPTIDTIEAIARALTVEPVQMIVPVGEGRRKIERGE
ncbi:helix-turn-helix domain-containing protein [Pseudaminobacter soli (ex Li et al. 2025)]|uniref:helix-turn-helix domain-containing protein n=1 Tax=Pseudaminobacter soli (ex Li et al. 2025) TaxID=1295366 RepID=UPI0011B22F8D|nr:hypothetical protein [Mesorhizobium soli]